MIPADANTHAHAQSYMERFRAPFSLRCGAMLIDYILLAGIIAFCTLLARLSSSHAQAAGSSAWTIGVFVAIAAALLNFVGLTSLRGQTVGKWATGLYVRRADGEPLSLGRSLVRHLVGYPVSLVLAGIGFLMAAFNANGRALHDLIAGTIVERQDQRRSRRAR